MHSSKQLYQGLNHKHHTSNAQCTVECIVMQYNIQGNAQSTAQLHHGHLTSMECPIHSAKIQCKNAQCKIQRKNAQCNKNTAKMYSAKIQCKNAQCTNTIQKCTVANSSITGGRHSRSDRTDLLSHKCAMCAVFACYEMAQMRYDHTTAHCALITRYEMAKHFCAHANDLL